MYVTNYIKSYLLMFTYSGNSKTIWSVCCVLAYDVRSMIGIEISTLDMWVVGLINLWWQNIPHLDYSSIWWVIWSDERFNKKYFQVYMELWFLIVYGNHYGISTYSHNFINMFLTRDIRYISISKDEYA